MITVNKEFLELADFGNIVRSSSMKLTFNFIDNESLDYGFSFSDNFSAATNGELSARQLKEKKEKSEHV